ncbi:MAG: DUF998 domain-containing protein [Eubacteriales bacterium]
MMNPNRSIVGKLTLLGAFGALLYALHVVLGGILWKGYNHIMQPISDLTATGAPDRVLLSRITLAYALCSITFAVCAYIYLRRSVPKVTRAGMITFFAMQLVSLSYGWFPQDMPGSAMTFAGTMHLVVTGLIVPLTICSPLLIGLGMRKLPRFRRFAIYSIITSIILFFAGGTTAMLFANKLPYFGLFERINIGSLQIWMLVFSLTLFLDKGEVKIQ